LHEKGERLECFQPNLLTWKLKQRQDNPIYRSKKGRECVNRGG
jgi:hypothetical protein